MQTKKKKNIPFIISSEDLGTGVFIQVWNIVDIIQNDDRKYLFEKYNH